MGKIILFISTILLFSCSGGSEYKYHIVGNVIKDNNYFRAEWFTDTISFCGDTAFYKNSDSSVVKIYPPYKIYEIKNETNN